MAPFKPLLSPKTSFIWDHSLEEAFERSKADIKEIEKGVEIFDPARRTCLSPDWSTTGVGYWLTRSTARATPSPLDAVPTAGG